MRYDQIYARHVQRAIDSGLIDIEALVGQMVDAGVPAARIEEMLLSDLENNGPIFGKFFRSLGVGAETAVSVAERQGAIVGSAIASDRELQRFLKIKDLGDVESYVSEATPEELNELEIEEDVREYTWIATLVNTCHLCVPLHGKTLMLREWRELGYDPSTIHSQLGLSAGPCKCRLEPKAWAAKSDLSEPLIRKKVKGSKRTMRAVSHLDAEKARSMVDQVMESKQGRAEIRRLGMANKEPAK